MLASCANCTHAESERCPWHAKPEQGGPLFERTELTDALRAEIVKLALAEDPAVTDLPALLARAQRATMFAG